MTRKLLLVCLGVGVLFAPSLAQVTIRPKPVNAVRVLCAANVAASAAADTTENVLLTCPLAANTLGTNGTLRVWMLWAYTNGANNKTFRVRLGGASGTQFLNVSATTTATASILVMIANRNAANAQIGWTTAQAGGLGTSASAVTTGTVDTAADSSVVISCQKATAGDTCTLERALIEVVVP